MPPMEITSSSGWGEKISTRLGKMASVGRAMSPGRLQSIGLSAGPAGDGFAEVAEDVDVDVVGRAVLGEEILQAGFVVIFVGELEDRLFELAGEPDDGFADRSFDPS